MASGSFLLCYKYSKQSQSLEFQPIVFGDMHHLALLFLFVQSGDSPWEKRGHCKNKQDSTSLDFH